MLPAISRIIAITEW